MKLNARILSQPLMLAVALVALVEVGCGKSGDALVPVSGHVLVNGKPAAGAAVVFHPVDQGGTGTRPLAQVDERGEFHLTTAKSGDGAVPGEYRVTLTWYVSTATKRGAEGDENPVRNLIPDKYARADTTPLTATVRTDGTEPVNIEITAPRR